MGSKEQVITLRAVGRSMQATTTEGTNDAFTTKCSFRWNLVSGGGLGLSASANIGLSRSGSRNIICWQGRGRERSERAGIRSQNFSLGYSFGQPFSHYGHYFSFLVLTCSHNILNKQPQTPLLFLNKPKQVNYVDCLHYENVHDRQTCVKYPINSQSNFNCKRKLRP